MTRLRPHQREAVDAVRAALEVPVAGTVPERGLRTQVVMATGSGKTLVAAQSAHELRAGRVLVLVPSLDLLAQTEAAWREAGRTGPMIGVSSLRGENAAFGNLLAPLDATYQGYRVGIWLKNQRAAARKAQEVEQRRAEGLLVQSAVGALAEVRREQLEDIAPSWCSAWPVEWQRAFHLVRSTWTRASRCRRRRVTSCARAKTSGGGCARSGSGGTS